MARKHHRPSSARERPPRTSDPEAARRSAAAEQPPQHTRGTPQHDAISPAPADRLAKARRAGLLPGLFVAAAALLAYSNAAPPVAIHDDAFFVPARYTLSLPSVAQMFREDTWSSTGAPQGTYRPLTILSIAVNGAMFGRSPAGYHATNIALHVLASVLVYVLVLQLIGAGNAWAAALAAAIFAVHPIHTEAVDSVFNRSEILATIGVAAGLCAIRRWHEQRAVLAWSLAAVLYFLALLCRESAVTLPVLAALMLWFTHADEAPAQRLRRILPVLFLAIPLAEYILLRGFALATQTQSAVPVLGVEIEQDLASRLLYSAAAVREYVRMMIWPWPLRLSYENFAGGGLASAALVHGVLLTAAIRLRRIAPIASFAIAFFYVALAPSTRVFTDLGSILQSSGSPLLHLKNTLLIAERAVYLPSISLAVAAGVALSALARRRGPAVAAACAALPLVAGTIGTLDRNRDWHSAPALFTAEVEAAPENGDGWRLLVSALQNAERYDEAAAACDSQLEQPGRSAQLLNNCGVVYDKLGRDEHAMKAYRRAIDLGLAAVGHANLGRVYARLGRMADAEAEFVAAVDAETNPAQRHYRTGIMLRRFHPGKVGEARREFEAALALQPDFAAAKQALAQMPR